MEYRLGQIVISRYGRDTGNVYMVVGVVNGRVLVANGDTRTLDEPKKKNPKHLNPTKTFLSLEEITTNTKLKKALNDYIKNCVNKNMSG